MIKESVFLFLLIGSGDSIEERYIGRLLDCSQSKEIFERISQKYYNINGYLCLDKADAREKFREMATPKQEKIIDELQDLLPPTPIPKPPQLIKKNN